MHKFVSFNHQILLSEAVSLSGVSSIALYGRGVFTTIAVYNSKPFLWEKHWKRLKLNASRLGLNLDEFSENSIKTSLLRIISQNKVENGRVRLTFFDESAKGFWKVENNKKTSLLIISADFRSLANKLNITVSPYPINSKSPLTNIKSCNYLGNLLAFEEAKVRGFEEAIRLNEKGEIVSACMANIFWLKADNIFTSSLETGCLAGTMRDFVLENFSVKEVNVGLEFLKEAEGIFLTSAGIGIAKVEGFGNLNFEYSPSFARIENVFNEFSGKASKK